MTDRNFDAAVARALEGGYEANPDAQAAVAGRDAVVFMGPSMVGVDTLIGLSGLTRTWGWTSHNLDPRDEYRQVATDEQRQVYLDKLEKRDFLFASQQPYTGDSYAIEPSDIPQDGIITLSLFQHELSAARAMFKSVKAIYVTAPFSDWRRRHRSSVREATYIDRVREGRESISAALIPDDTYWVLNKNDEAGAAAERVKAYVFRGERDELADHEAKEYGRLMIRGFSKLMLAHRLHRVATATLHMPVADPEPAG